MVWDGRMHQSALGQVLALLTAKWAPSALAGASLAALVRPVLVLAKGASLASQSLFVVSEFC
jgi:hypothetical protein